MSIDFSNLSRAIKNNSNWVDTNFKLISKDPWYTRLFHHILSKVGLYSFENIKAANVLNALDHQILDTFFDIDIKSCPTKSNLEEITTFLLTFDLATKGLHNAHIQTLIQKIELFKYGSLPTMLFAKNSSARANLPCEKSIQMDALVTQWKRFYHVQEDNDEIVSGILELFDPKIVDHPGRSVYVNSEGHIYLYEKRDDITYESCFNGSKATETPVEKPKSGPQSTPSYEAFKQLLKKIHGDNYPTLSLRFEAVQLKNFIGFIDKLKPTPALNQWVIGCLTHLQKKAEKLGDAGVKEFVSQSLLKFPPLAIVEELKVQDTPPPPVKPLVNVTERPPMQEVVSTGKATEIQIFHTPSKVTFIEKTREQVVEQLQSWERHIETLKQNNQLEQLDRDLIIMMDSFDEVDFIKGMINQFSEEETQDWVKHLKYFVATLVQNHYKLQRHPFPAGHIVSTLRLLEMQLHAIARFQKDRGTGYVPYFTGTFIPHFIDSYLSFENHGSEVYFLANRIRNYDTSGWGADFGDIRIKSSNQRPSYVFEAAESFLYLKMVIEENKILHIKKPTIKSSDVTSTTRIELQENSKKIRKLLKGLTQEIELVWSDSESSYIVQPLGLYLRDVDFYNLNSDSMTEGAFSNYKTQGAPILSNEYRCRVTESSLSSYANGQRQFTGNNPTHDILLDDNFSFPEQSKDFSYKLQLAQTDNDRPRMNLLLFSAHPTALNDPQLMRMFYLFFSQGGYAGAFTYYYEHPEHIPELVHHLQELDQHQKKGAFPIEGWAEFVSMTKELLGKIIATLENEEPSRIDACEERLKFGLEQSKKVFSEGEFNLKACALAVETFDEANKLQYSLYKFHAPLDIIYCRDHHITHQASQLQKVLYSYKVSGELTKSADEFEQKAQPLRIAIEKNLYKFPAAKEELAKLIRSLKEEQSKLLAFENNSHLRHLRQTCEASIATHALSNDSLKQLRDYLYIESLNPSRSRTLDDRTFIFKAYFAFSYRSAEKYAEDKPQIGRLIDSFAKEMLTECKKNPSLVDEIISYCFMKKNNPRDWIFEEEGFLIQSGEIKLNLRSADIVRQAQLNQYIPTQHHKFLKGLIPAELLKKKHVFSFARSEEKTFLYLKLEGVEIWLPFSKANQPFIEIHYKNPQGISGKYALIPNAEEQFKECLPKDVKGCPCYISSDKKELLFLGTKGEVRYSAHVNTQMEIVSVEQHFLSDLPKNVILNASNDKLSLLLRICDKSNLIFFGSKDQVEVAYDMHLGLTFQWNTRLKVWDCYEFEGYSTSADSVDRHYKAMNQYSMSSVREGHTVFRSDFDRYLLLKHSDSPSKMIIPHNEFICAGGKYSRKLIPLDSEAKSKAHVFTIDAEKGLSGSTPSDYLYLSYVYLAQGRYVEASHALSEGFLRMQTIDSQSLEILNWIERWEDKHPNAIALKLAIQMCSLQLEDKGFHTLNSLLAAEFKIKKLFQLSGEYLSKQNKVHRQLQIPQAFLNERLRFYALRLGDLEYKKFMTASDIDFISSLGDEPKKKAKILEYALSQEIESLSQAVKPQPVEKKLTSEECAAGSHPVYTFVNPSKWLVKGAASAAKFEEVDSVITELKTYFEGKDSYAKEIIDDEIVDMEIHQSATQKQVPLEFNAQSDWKEIRQQFTDAKQKIEANLSKLKQHIIANFQLDMKESATMQDLKEVSPIAEDLFRKGKQSIQESEWQNLVEKGFIDNKQIPELKQSYHHYLKLCRENLQIQKILKLVDKCQSNPSKTEELAKLGQLLAARSPYNPDTFPFAKAILLIETELGIILTENQFVHIAEMINNPSSFKQEKWGSGKTTVIRNIIAKIHADGYNLSGVLTDQALVQAHHRLLKETTANAFGDEAYLNTFSRDVKIDKLTILNEHRKVLQIIRDGGRMDQTLHTFVSMLHSKTLRLLRLKSDDKEAIGLIKSLEKLLALYRERAVFGSDELDQVGNPHHYHNFGEGKIKLSEDIYNPALILMRHVKTDPRFETFRIYYSTKHTKAMTEQERSDLLNLFASVAIEQLNCGDLNEELLKSYLVGSTEKNVIDYFHSHLKTHAKHAEIMSYQVMITQTIGTSFDRVSGVKFWRSEDGIRTKPCLYAGKCNEKGENSSIELTVWDTCVDYMRKGVALQAIKTYVNFMKQKSQNEILLMEGGTINDTPTGVKFKAHFGISLSEVEPSHFPAIQQTINGNLEWIIDFMVDINFEEYFYSTGRIDGHAAYASHYMRELWGSSGNTESARAMPHKVNLHADMYRQKGAAGHVYVTFIQEMSNPETQVETYDYSIPFEEYLAARLNPGSAYVDAAPFFEGLSNESIATKLAAHLPKDRKARFQGEGDDVIIQGNDGKQEKDIGLVDLNTTNTLFPKKDTRGTNFILPSQKENVISISSDTDVTTFTQAIMRDRAYGKGSRFRYIQDSGFQHKLGREDLKGLSRAAKYLILFAEEEAANQKKLNYILNTQEIAVAGIRTVQALLEMASEEEYFELLTKAREIHPQWFISPSSQALERRAAPRQKQSGHSAVEALNLEEIGRLEKLKETLTHPVQQTFLSEVIKRLEKKNLILNAKYLLDEVRGSEHDQNVVVVEVESEVTGEVEADVDIQVEQELAIDSEQANDTETAFEQDLRRGRALSRFGDNRPYNPSRLQQFLIDLNPWYGDERDIDAFEANFANPEVYPGTGLRLSPTMDMHRFHSQFPDLTGNWMTGEIESIQIYYPAVYLFAEEHGKTGALLGNASDAKYADHAKKRVTGQFSQPLESFVNYHLFSKLDITAYDVPKNCIEPYKRHIAMSKLVFGFAPLNMEDKAIITQWMNVQPNKQVLIDNFRKYCARHCSKNDKIDLLDLFNGLK
ncbi:MAG: DUF3638 domain-containing protein [Parachlamydiales bacterium]|jgi:hypothetical protein